MERRELDEIGRFFQASGYRTPLAYYGLEEDAPNDVIEAAIKKKRTWAQGQQANPKYRAEALFLIKSNGSLRKLLLEERDVYAQLFASGPNPVEEFDAWLEVKLKEQGWGLPVEILARAEGRRLELEANTVEVRLKAMAERLGLHRTESTDENAALAGADLYELLEVQPGTDQVALEVAYRARYRWARSLKDPERSGRMLAQLDAAWRIVSDPAKRARYDEQRNAVGERTEEVAGPKRPASDSGTPSGFSASQPPPIRLEPASSPPPFSMPNSGGPAPAGTASAGTASAGTASAGTASAGTASAGTASAVNPGGAAAATQPPPLIRLEPQSDSPPLRLQSGGPDPAAEPARLTEVQRLASATPAARGAGEPTVRLAPAGVRPPELPDLERIRSVDPESPPAVSNISGRTIGLGAGPQQVRERAPRLVVPGKGIVRLEVPRSRPVSWTLKVQNAGQGRMPGRLVSDVDWLVPSRVALDPAAREQEIVIDVMAELLRGNRDSGSITVVADHGERRVITFEVARTSYAMPLLLLGFLALGFGALWWSWSAYRDAGLAADALLPRLTLSLDPPADAVLIDGQRVGEGAELVLDPPKLGQPFLIRVERSGFSPHEEQMVLDDKPLKRQIRLELVDDMLWEAGEGEPVDLESAALDPIRAQGALISKCYTEGERRKAAVSLTIRVRSSGEVLGLDLEGGDVDHVAARPCVARILRATQIAPFSGGEWASAELALELDVGQ